MKFRFLKWVTPVIAGMLLAFAAGCGGGGTTTPDVIGEAFSLLVQANPDTGGSPLTVSFFAVPSGGQAPYEYAWDFDGDGVTDSNAPQSYYVYTALGAANARVTVTDNAGQIVIADKTVILTNEVTPTGENLVVRFNATPQYGPVPLDVKYTSYISGGTPPYQYEWDFDGLGLSVGATDPMNIKSHVNWDPDSFEQNPRFIYEHVGEQPTEGSSSFLVNPVLVVTDGRGVMGSNLTDADFNGEADFRYVINAYPPLAGLTVAVSSNPANGQAPLNVEFTAASTGGSNEVEYKWTFGDGGISEYAPTSITSHTYLNPGVYFAQCTAHDKKTNQVVTSARIEINATVQQNFSITISADTATTVGDQDGNEWEFVAGQVPFVTNFEVKVKNGKEPIEYRWDVFDDNSAIPVGGTPTTFTEQPSLLEPPQLNSAAVVTPDFTFRKSPTFHFGNGAYDTVGVDSYVVSCAATDAVGNTAVSNLVRVRAENRTGNPLYEAHRPQVNFATAFLPPGTAHPSLQPGSGALWSPRANAAVCSHPSGISYIIGGEILDENGRFESLVQQGDSVYQYVPRAGSLAYEGTTIGKFSTGTHGGSMIRLNAGSAPAFPGPADRNPPAQATNRSTGFQVVGSAAAVFMHEIPESNPAGAYLGKRNDPMTQPAPYPDDPTGNWGLDGGIGGAGLGSPIIYVLGGRVGAQQPVNLVQKYYVFGFGSEDLAYDSLDPELQVTSNQTDLWSAYFLRPDTDHYPPPADPEINDRTPGGSGSSSAAPLPDLPDPLFGLMATKIETAVSGSTSPGVDSPSPSFPNGPFSNVFIFGGIDQNGSVSDVARYWNIGLEPDGEIGIDDGLWSELDRMPTPRAYGKAVMMPPVGGLTRIALIGGIGATGAPLNSIDILTFQDSLSPNAGTWETFGGSFPEALQACAGGYNSSREPGQSWVVALGGWNGEDYTSKVYTARVASDGTGGIVTESLPVMPRRNMASTQGGSWLLEITYNRYYLFAGTDENGADGVVEVVSLP